MPWQLSGNGRSDWSTKLIRGLKAEAAAGFQSRRERCSEPTPATPQYAAFSTYKAARVHIIAWQCDGVIGHCCCTAEQQETADWYNYGIQRQGNNAAVCDVSRAVAGTRLD